MVRIAINGYGRIGRLEHRVLLDTYGEYAQVVAINAGSSTDIKGWMYLLKYDSVYGMFNKSITYQVSSIKYAVETIGALIIDGGEVPVFSEKDPSLLPWKELKVDVVIESTGHLLTKEQLQTHLKAGARRVVLSAPGKDGVPTYVISVNEDTYAGEDIISNASCTTNCIAPVAQIIQENFGIEKAMMTTIHGYTSDQRLQDGGHKDYRRARAAGENIIPTTTGATKAVAQALPSLANKFEGLAIRVPVATGSLSDFTFLLEKDVTREEVNAVFEKAAETKNYQGILSVTNDPIVSSDIIGNPLSALVDLSLTQVVGGNLLKVVAWYDNEYGYANRLVEEAIMVGNTAKSS